MEKINQFTKNNGNCILIVKGTETGILALKDIIDGILNFVETSGKMPKIVTDDNPLVYLGFCDFDKDSFSFYLITQNKTIFDKPIKVIEKIGCELIFYRS